MKKFENKFYAYIFAGFNLSILLSFVATAYPNTLIAVIVIFLFFTLIMVGANYISFSNRIKGEGLMIESFRLRLMTDFAPSLVFLTLLFVAIMAGFYVA